MAAHTTLKSRTDALVMVAAVIGLAIVLNALATQTSARLDLTEQKVHTLSAASQQAAESLEGVVVTAYISKKLPESIPTANGLRPLKGIDRALRDKLEEYATASGGHLRLVYADENTPAVGSIEDQAEAARLEPFSSSEASVQGNQLKFARYVLGATFHYKTVHEVLPKALEPGFYEFEITKILLRLKEKYEQSQLMKDPLDAGKAVHEAVKACNDAVQKAAKVDDAATGGAGLSLQGSNDPAKKRLDAVRAALPDLQKTCGGIESAMGTARAKLQGKSQFGDNLLQDAEQFRQVQGELVRLSDPAAEQNAQVPPGVAIPQIVNVLAELYREVDRDHATLTDSPGRRQIGFLCGHDEFCPFGEASPLIRDEVAGMMGQSNPMMKQVIDAAKQISQSIDETNSRIGENLFTKKGFSIRRVDADQPIPDDVSALLIYAPRKPFSEYTRYQIDQMLVGGRPVVVFAQEWEVALMNLAASDDLNSDLKMDHTALTPTQSSLVEFLKPYGVELKHDLVLDSTHVETVRVTQLVNRGGLQFEAQQDFPYALIPVAADFDETHALSRSIQHMALPYTTSVTATAALRKDPKFEVVDLIRSSETSLTKSAPLPVMPPALKELVLAAAPNGPHTLAMSVQGPFKSAFQGKAIPKMPERKVQPDPNRPEPPQASADTQYEVDKRKFKPEGKGKLLVIASNLGIEGLSRQRVLGDFDLSKFTEFNVEAIKSYQKWQAEFQNWQIRIGQVSHLLGDNLQFLQNVMDWATSHEGLVAIRAKGDSRRPLQQVEATAARNYRLGTLLGAPLLLILAGLARWRFRRRRNTPVTVA
jgi:ABC-type uncharacterized transport system involved in gliding motility auxiliary subunit